MDELDQLDEALGAPHLRPEALARLLADLSAATLAVYEAGRLPDLARLVAFWAGRLSQGPAAAFVVSVEGRLIRGVSGDGHGPARPARVPEGPLDELMRERLGDRVGAENAVLRAEAWDRSLFDPGPGLDVALVAARTKHGRPPVCLAVPALVAADSEILAILNQLVHATALAAEAIRSYDEEHGLALTLQRSFLPQRIPPLPGLGAEVRYVPASEQAEIGGDFYAGFEVPGGSLVAIGDVAGHSLKAATIMVELRHGLRAYAAEGHGPEAVLDRLDRLLTRFHPGVTATLCVAFIDPAARLLRVANAGHLPPLLLPADGPARYVDARGPMLGLGLGRPDPTELVLPARSSLVMVTDGLVETRGVNLTDSLEELRLAAEEGPAGSGSLCDYLLDRFGTDREDDIALLAVRLTGD